MARLKTSADRTTRNFEESKEGDDEKVVRNQVVEWCRDGVSTLTEHLDRNEKIRAISQVMDDIQNADKEP